ncbi:coagulation factor XI-like [Schistocerca americana]|uniref:coagulation factor XI-like n=1 Tax=Schistocerca americana TaxID=7009 RepID=UPI001F4F367E|nr:coagulation factor XI-like [Schistocerca americana]
MVFTSFSLHTIPTFLLTTLLVPSTVNAYVCGLTSGSRVVGGVKAPAYAYPWFAELLLRGEPDNGVCAGALISRQHVLTAAHCFVGILEGVPNDKKYKVALGMSNQCVNQNTRKIYDVARADVHERYTTAGNDYDIALLTLKEPAHFMPLCPPWEVQGASRLMLWGRPADAPKPLVLPDDGGRTGLVAGMGTTRPGVSSSTPCEIRHALVTVLTRRECLNTRLPRVEAMQPGIICAGELAGGVDTCQGDSGGAMMTKSGRQYVATGIVSYGYGCGQRNMPGVYTNVSYYKDWIVKHMGSGYQQRLRSRTGAARLASQRRGGAAANAD